ncbi:MAG: patatin-like phospholipase family protein [Quisquiliibacterium sp.]
MGATRGLILMGGGANAAYQVGVLDAVRSLAQQYAQCSKLPFSIVCGTSAGAINAAALTAWADDFGRGIAALDKIWTGLRVGDVYRVSAADMMSASMRWLGLVTVGGLLARGGWGGQSLLDNSPLRELLHRQIPMDRVSQMLGQGVVESLAVTAYSYTHGEHVTFYRSEGELRPWLRTRRVAHRTHLRHEHLLASAALPFVFPAVRLDGPRGRAFFGDGAMGQLSPIAPAIHLGADRIMVISSAARQQESRPIDEQVEYPSLARIAGHTLSALFMDALAVDTERLGRINRTLSLIPPPQREQTGLKPIDLFHLMPSRRIEATAERYLETLPWTVKRLLGMLGASRRSDPAQGRELISYLLFEGAFTQELIALGRSDAMAQRDQIVEFMGWATADSARSAAKSDSTMEGSC